MMQRCHCQSQRWLLQRRARDHFLQASICPQSVLGLAVPEVLCFSNSSVLSGGKKEELLPLFIFLGGFNYETPQGFTSALGSILKEVASGVTILPALFLFSLVN